jgi:hypothetical protein
MLKWRPWSCKACVARATSEIGCKRVTIPNITVTRDQFTTRCNNRDEKALNVWLQNLLDSPLIAFMWGFSRCWSVRVGLIERLSLAVTPACPVSRLPDWGGRHEPERPLAIGEGLGRSKYRS